MQKIVNVLAVSSFLVSAAIVAGGSYVYLNRDNLVEGVKSQITAGIKATVADALPGMLDAAMPKMPEVTGGAIPEGGTSLPTTTGPALPF